MGEKRNVCKVLVEKPEGTRPLERPRRRWEDNIKMDLREIGWSVMGWIDLAQDRDQWEGPCEYGNEPSGSTKCWESIEWLSNWWLRKKGSAKWSSLVS
jgi:hypothetical protein